MIEDTSFAQLLEQLSYSIGIRGFPSSLATE